MKEIIRVCKKHGELTIDDVYKSKNGVSFSFKCKKCRKDYEEKNREKRLAYSREYEKTKRKRPDNYYEEQVKKNSRDWRRRNADKVNEKIREDRKSNPEKYREYDRKWREENLEKARYLDVVQKHNISFDEYMLMIEKQKGLCAICGREEKRRSRTEGQTCRLVVDHHHASGRIRELLCHNCNTGIGKFEENTILLEKAIHYLNKHNHVE